MQELQEMLFRLCRAPGAAGREDSAAEVARQELAFLPEVKIDTLGSVVASFGDPNAKTHILLDAHLDQIGMVVTSIDEKGFLKVAPDGGMDRRVLLGKQVLVGDRQVPGVIGLKAIHMTTAEERKKVPKLEDYYIDIGASSREEAEALVEVGDPCVFRSDCVEFGDSCLKAKALDDRVGCAVLLELLRRDLPMDCTFVFTVQEEVGTRGAFGAAFSVTPDIALVLEGTTAADAPSQDPEAQICHLGQGPVLSWMDKGTIYDRDLFERLRAVAQEHNIPWQLKHYVAGSTDAKAIQRTKSGVRVAGISAPVRYLHAPASVVNINDVEQVLELAWLFLQSVAGDC